jgi:hypothetical protein
MWHRNTKGRFHIKAFIAIPHQLELHKTPPFGASKPFASQQHCSKIV